MEELICFSFAQALPFIVLKRKTFVHIYLCCLETSHHHHTYLAHTQGQRRPKMKGNNPYLIVVLVQAIYAAMFLLSKAAFDHGMNNFIFVFYRQAVATIFLTPFTFFFEWYVEIICLFYTHDEYINLNSTCLTMPVFNSNLVWL